jgi:AAA+ superfamily predicted ATPase
MSNSSGASGPGGLNWNALNGLAAMMPGGGGGVSGGGPNSPYNTGDRVFLYAEGKKEQSGLDAVLRRSGVIDIPSFPKDTDEDDAPIFGVAESIGLHALAINFSAWKPNTNFIFSLSEIAPYVHHEREWIDEPEKFQPKGSMKKIVEELKLDEKEIDRVVMPKDTKKRIFAVLKQYKNSAKIFEEWGLGETIEYGKGMTMLFHGPPGTGKTWTATCIAKAIGKKLTVVESAALESSEPGGFERTLKTLFTEAKKKRSILFIDECDSLVQSRMGMGQILSAQTNCLLTEIEKFEGILILATNRVDDLDAAVERRISLIEEFKMPTAEERKAIWGKLVPKKMPLTKDVDFGLLAEKYELSGGLIKNVVLNAARGAVSEDADKVSLIHFERALEATMKGKKTFTERKPTVLHGYRSGKSVDKGVVKNNIFKDE